MGIGKLEAATLMREMPQEERDELIAATSNVMDAREKFVMANAETERLRRQKELAQAYRLYKAPTGNDTSPPPKTA